LLQSLDGHEKRSDDSVYPRRTLGVSFHPNGRELASAGWEGAVRTWNTETGAQLRIFRVDQAVAITAVYSPDGSQIAAAFSDGTVRIWDPSNGRETRQLPCASDGGSAATSTSMLAFRPDGRWLAACSNSLDGAPGEVRVFDSATGRLIFSLRGHTSKVVAVAFSPDGTRIATAGFDLTVKLWETETGQEVCTLRGHTAGVLSVAFSRDGQRIVTSGMDNMVKVWDATPLGSSDRLRPAGSDEEEPTQRSKP
jgi:WD40 repeat protein